MPTAVDQQRSYYERTAEHYDSMHVRPLDEHGLSLAAFAGIADLYGPPTSILDVGAGTGRGIQKLALKFPQAKVLGIEPVAALREIGHRNGIPSDRLIDGDVLQLDFPDNSVDWVTETGVLHHVATPLQAVAEMTRVARIGIMISDSNNVGQGTYVARSLKAALRLLGLWHMFIRIQTSGKMYKISEGDGVYYSFCAFDCAKVLQQKFPFIRYMNTTPCSTPNLYFSATHTMIVATK